MDKNLNQPDRIALLQRIAAEKDLCVSEFIHRMKLLQQQEEALTRERQPAGQWVPVVRRDKAGRSA